MAPTDLENLVDMGFEKPKAEMALKKSGNCKAFRFAFSQDVSC